MTMRPRTLVLALALAAGVACDFPTTKSTMGGQPSVASYSPRRFMVDLGAGMISSEFGAAVSGAFFKDAKVEPLLGRALNDADQSQATVVLSHALWTERFKASPTLIGEELVIDDRRMIVVGIMPESFKFPEGARLWVKR
jgi:hypothetical protein